ncbi:hypothetical protein [Streptomyces sp. R08]|uniref:Minor tail protein n=1 Tax=Streptomyces sp. R08 TaxID=3238624 RepID=A0AB39MFK2_9ACTN
MSYGNPNLIPDASSGFESGSHGWTAGSNTTLSVVTGQWLSGAQSLRATATAAGSVTFTSPRITGITGGAEYVARVPIRRNSTTAGQVATLTITWYNAASGGTSLGTSVTTLTLTGTGTGWFYYNYPVVAANAPAAALSATITLAVSGMAAAEYVGTDDVYLGVTQSYPGNVYGFNTASIEVDTSGWKIDTGSMVRGNWILFGGSGYYALEYTSAAAGTIDIRTNSFIGVVPGTTYLAYACIYAPVVATTWYVELRWYDSAFNEVGTREQRTYSVGVASIQRTAIVGTAPTGAMYTKAFYRPVATAANQVFVIDDASLLVAPNAAGNLLTYDEYSAESALPAWTFDNGTTAWTYFDTTLTDGYGAVRVQPTTQGLVTGTLNRLVPVTAGTTYKVAAVMYRQNTDTAQTISSASRVRVDWYDSAGNLLSPDNPDQFYNLDSPIGFAAQSITETRTAPDGTAFARVGVEFDSTSPLINYWYVDNVVLVAADPEYTLVTDNDTGRVTLTVNSTPPAAYAATKVTVRRMDDDGKSSQLRGYGYTYDLAPYSVSPILIEDYEAPLGSRVWYNIEWFKADNSRTGYRLYTQSVDAPTLANPDYVWFKSPGLPALNTQLMVEAPIKWQREARAAGYSIVGRRNPVIVTDTRPGRTATLTLLVWDEPSNTTFDALLDTGLPALIQATPGYGIDGNLYLSIGQVEVESVTNAANIPGWRWTLSVTEIDRPGGGLQGSSSGTWQTVYDTFATWSDMFSAQDSWADVLTNPAST